MSNEVIAKLTKEEVDESYEFRNRILSIEEEMSELLEKRAKLERERVKWWSEIRRKYGLKESNYSICHVTGEVEEE